MLHNRERHARFRRQMSQQFHRRLESAGRAADAYNRATSIFAFACDVRVSALRFGAVLVSLFMRCSVFCIFCAGAFGLLTQQ